MPLLKYLWTDDFKYFEVRNWTEITIKNWDIVNAEEDSKLNEYPNLFEEVFYGNWILKKRVVLTQAQMTNMHTTWIELVAPQAKWVQIMPICCIFSRNKTWNYTNVNLYLNDQADWSWINIVSLPSTDWFLNYWWEVSIMKYCSTSELQWAMQKWGTNWLYLKAASSVWWNVNSANITIDLFYVMLDIAWIA